MRGSLTENNFTIAGILTAFAMVPGSPARGAERGDEIDSARRDCRYSAVEEATPSTTVETRRPLESVFLPDTDVFRPILADQLEPRFYADYRRVHFRSSSLLTEGNGDEINAAMVAIGGEVGVWGLREPRGCDGLQVSLFGAAFAQFNLDVRSLDLLNADYLVGPVVTYRRGPWSARLRFYHRSSHLGDKFLLNYGLAHGVDPQHPSFEALDLLVSLEDTWWRLYGGGGLVVTSKDPDVSSTPAFVQYGFELRGPAWIRLGNSSLRPVFGANFSDLQATGWSLNGSLEGGLEWASRNAAQRIRALLVAQRGALPFSQFFLQKTHNVGFQLQFEL
jgi:hypothetical protein